MKKRFLLVIALLCIVSTAFVQTPVLAAEKGPIIIGFFAPLTGFAAQTGKDMLSGLQRFPDECVMGLGGSDDADGLDSRIFQNFSIFRSEVDMWITLPHEIQTAGF